jgi:hypothetical protein
MKWVTIDRPTIDQGFAYKSYAAIITPFSLLLNQPDISIM